ncbi:MAG: NAD(P)H-dependent glycerol-3-phosphate dehydrogenase [Proteobacteria bacterium]|nr:NAD(P)H-dependent glycerol-3-phosphate dehydrogenase [Pseudomonadota bacterium]
MSLKWGVVGGGAWGTALANTLAHAGNDVMVWDRDPLVVDDVNSFHQNRKRYPDLAVHDKLRATDSLEELAEHSTHLLVAVPSEVNVVMATQVSPYLTGEHKLVVAAKGFRESDGALMTEVWREAAPQVQKIAVVTGPTFARELMEKKVTAMLVASPDAALRAEVADSFETEWVRIYENSDMVGAQVGGAVKNVLAIGAGILDGLEMGYNARAAMLTRGLGEMARFVQALGGKSGTVWGLAGMGDLLLTATSTLSRNYRFGQLVGKGVPVHEAKLRVGTVEGILAARIMTVQAQAHGLDLAIVSAVDGILHCDVTPLQAIEYLMQRPRTVEFDG